MKTPFSGNSDLLAVAVILAATAIGSAIDFERRAEQRLPEQIATHARKMGDRIGSRTRTMGDRIAARTRIRLINRQIQETRREIDSALKTIACER